jgi:hypothetical protein
MRKCKNPNCKKDISNKHPNAKFCKTKCKDNFHNTTDSKRLARAKQYAPKKVVTETVVVKRSRLEMILDKKIAMAKVMDVDQD